MKAIKSKANFTLEIEIQLSRLDDSIAATRMTVSMPFSLSSLSATHKINKLKLQEFHLKGINLALAMMNENDWETQKEGMQKEFLKATDELARTI